MSEKKHTASPWKGDRYDGTIKYTARGGDDRPVLVINNKTGDYGFTCPPDEDCQPDCYERHAADERLFLAAPDLLAALQRYVDDYGASVNTADLRAQAEAAIAKAGVA